MQEVINLINGSFNFMKLFLCVLLKKWLMQNVLRQHCVGSISREVIYRIFFW